MRRLLAKIMVVVACCVLLLHAMVPHHNMSCGLNGLYVLASSVHYGMCEESNDCYKTIHYYHANEDLCGCSSHDGMDLGGHSSNSCRIQELLTQSLISSNENDIYTAIVCDKVLDLFFDEIGIDAIVDNDAIIGCEWGGYILKLPVEWVLSDAPLRAPPVC